MIKFCIISIGFTSLIILSILLTIVLYPSYLTIEQTKQPIQEIDDFERNVFKEFGFDTHYDEGIDIVYLWIDQKSRIYLKDWRIIESWESLSDQAFIMDKPPNFVQYFLRLVWKNVPWIKRIHMIVPTVDYLRYVNISHPKIHVVEHKDFINEEFRPNFNWRAVLSHIPNIETISPHFLLFTDTMYPVHMDPSFFIDPSTGARKIYLMNRQNDPLNEEEENIVELTKHLILNRTKLTDDELNKAKNITVETRVPILMSKSILKRLETQYYEIFENIRSHRFRSTKSYDLLHLHHYHLIVEDIKLNLETQLKLQSLDTNNDGQIDENELKTAFPTFNEQTIKFPTNIKDPQLIQLLKEQGEHAIKIIDNDTNATILESHSNHLSNLLKDFEQTNKSILYLGASFLMDATFQSLSALERYFQRNVPDLCPYENFIPSPTGFINLAGIFVVGGGSLLLMVMSKRLSVKSIKSQ